MPRLFVAVDIPDADKQALSEMQTGLPGARWTNPHQMHLTLHFLGEMPLQPVLHALQNIQANSFSLNLSGIGTFPPKGKAHVLWAGVSHSAPLIMLYQKVGVALKTIGYQPEERAYHPHITLARFKQPPPKEALATYLHAHQTFETKPFTVNALTLYKSELKPNGVVYSAQGKIALP